MKRFDKMLAKKESHSGPENQINSQEKELKNDDEKEKEIAKVFHEYIPSEKVNTCGEDISTSSTEMIWKSWE